MSADLSAAESADDERELLDDDKAEIGLPRRRRRGHRVICGVKCDGFAAIVSAMAVFAAVVTVALVINIIVHNKQKSSSSWRGHNVSVAVSSDSPTCTKLAIDLLKQNGSAVDAAVGALLCLGVVHPQSSGIGGGGFMVIKNSTHHEVIDAREVAPSAANKDMFERNSTLMLHSGLAVAVPGELKGLELAHRRHGNLAWKDVVMPASKLASGGFPAEEALVHALTSEKDRIMATPSMAVLAKNLLKDGKVPAVDQTLTRPELADTLEVIANSGSADGFYSGKIAQSIVDAVQSFGGIITMADLQSYQPKKRNATQVKLSMAGVEGWTILSAPTPASGAVLSLIANIMDGYTNLDDSVLSYHRMIESFKFAYGQRSWLGDPGFNYSVNASQITARMLDRQFANELRGKISDAHTFNVSYYGGHFDVRKTPGTTHLSVLRGNDAVAVTSTVNTYFGAGAVTSTGIVLNNEMNDFSAPGITNAFGLPPSPANFVEPGKKPLSSQSPTIVLDNNGTVRAVLGASGGTKITTTTYQVLANMLMKGKNVVDAIAQYRLHHQLEPDFVFAETTVPASLKTGLEGKQHIVNSTYTALAVCQAIHRAADGTVTAHADVGRKGGLGEVSFITV